MKDEKIKEVFQTWYPAVKDFCQTKAFDSILTKLVALRDQGKVISPELKNIFKAFQLCDMNETKVIWIGLDPYFNGEATGLN